MMELKTFYREFELIAEAPNGIQKLREMTLQLAVQGKLVPQDPNDEPASVLLEKIETEKKRLVKEGFIKKSKKLPPIENDEPPFNLPDGWMWGRLGQICIKLNDGTHSSPPNTSSGSYKYVTAKNIKPDGVDLSNITYVTEEVHNSIYSRCNPEFGDILYIKDGATTGIVTINNLKEPFSMLSSVALLKLPKYVFNGFIKLSLQSPFFYNLIRKDMSGIAITRVTLTKLSRAIIPLPPMGQQKRIAEKVDELLALCDDLEARKQKTHQTCIKLNDASIDRLLKAPTPGKFNKQWYRIQNNFDLLYNIPENVTNLRPAILQLAVQGKLVPQDSNDEPASVLLEKINAERDQLIKDGKIRKSKTVPPIDQSSLPFTLPNSWEWVRLGLLCETITKGSSPKWQGVSYVDSGDGILFITSENVGNYSLKMDKAKYVEQKFNQIEPRSILKKNDILMNIVGASIGRTAIFALEDIANINQAVCLIRMLNQRAFFELRYFLYFFNSPTCIGYMFNKQVDNARANLSMTNISLFPIPVPPLQEQIRIVTKVDELMDLCDDLEGKLSQGQTDSSRLVDAVVADLLVA